MIAIVGNNDGPLRLMQSMQKVNLTPVCVGLQKPVDVTLQQKYMDCIDKAQFTTGFDEDRLFAWLQTFQVDTLINCFCNFKFTRLLDTYNVLNVHLAPLPRYRGRHPLHWALINGEPEFGVSIHQMTRTIDAGEIYWQKMTSVRQGTSVQKLRESLMQLLDKSFGTFVQDFMHQNIQPMPNPEAKATYVARRFPEDSVLTEWHDSHRIYRKVMALRSESNAACLVIHNQAIPVTHACLSHRRYVGFAQSFICRLLPDGVEIVCLDGLTVQLLGFDPKQYSLKLNQKL